jgi:hypothetical protein
VHFLPVLSNLAVGPHKFKVVAVDTAGNKDPNPAIFSWIIVSATTQSIQQLIQLKHSMHLDRATDQTLDSQLNAALQFTPNHASSSNLYKASIKGIKTSPPFYTCDGPV